MIRMTGTMVVALALLISGLAGCGGDDSPSAAEAPVLTVYAAASTTEAMETLCRRFETLFGARVDLSLAASSTLAKQIASGAPAGVYLSANLKWMDYLEEHEAVEPATRVDLLGNRLVIVAAALKDGAAAAGPVIDFNTTQPPTFEGRLAVGDPEHVPAGIYARAALESLGWWQALGERLAPAVDVRAALRLVETGECELGIVYSTDAAASTAVRIVATLPQRTHDAIRYPVAVCRGLDVAAAARAREFIAFLRGPEASAVFRGHGFETLAAQDPAVARAASGGGWLAWRQWLDGPTLGALRLSARVGLWCVALTLVPGVGLGWLLARRRFRGRALLSAVVHAPMVVPPVVVGYAALLLAGRNGPLGRLLDRAFGIQLAFTWQAAALAAAVMALPLMVRSVRLAVEMVDRRLEQAAGTLGASPWRTFLTVTLPLAAPGVMGGAVLAFARSLGEFGATITFAGNIAGQTRTLPLAIYTLTQTPGGDGRAMALAGISVLVSVAAVGLSEALHRRLGAAAA